MGQSWTLFNIDKREYAAETGWKLADFFFDDFFLLLRLITIPCFPREAERLFAKGLIATQPGPFGKLPTELIDAIFRAVFRCNMFGSAAVLSATCKLLFEVGKPYVLKDLVQVHARWAYGRIICLGGVTKGEELPAGMLTDAEQREIDTTYIEGIGKEASDDSERCFSIFAWETYRADTGVSTEFPSTTEAGYGTMSDWYRRPRNPVAKRDKQMLNILIGISRLSYPKGTATLFNLSKGEYVRQDTLTALSLEVGGDRPGDLPYRMNLAQALLSRVCWSHNPSIAMACDEKYEKAFTMGPWAGDRFCITILEKKPKLPEGMEWKDVTEEVDPLLHHLWMQNTI